MSTITSYYNNANQYDVQITSGTVTSVSGVNSFASLTLPVVNGLNIAQQPTGVSIVFSLPNSFCDQAREFKVINATTGFSVVVSGASALINGSTGTFAISGNSAKSFYCLYPGVNTIISGVSTPVTTGNWVTY